MLKLQHIFIIAVLTASSMSASSAVAFEVRYQAHMANIGDEAPVEDGFVAGSVGIGRDMQAIRIWNGLGGCSIEYQAHSANRGWMPTVKQGEVGGSTGQGLALQAIRIWLQNCPNQRVRYRAHIANIGWQGWVTQGEMAGTTGRSLAIQALQITVDTSGNAEVEQLVDTRNGLANQDGDTQFRLAATQAQRNSVMTQKAQADSQLAAIEASKKDRANQLGRLANEQTSFSYVAEMASQDLRAEREQLVVAEAATSKSAADHDQLVAALGSKEQEESILSAQLRSAEEANRQRATALDAVVAETTALTQKIAPLSGAQEDVGAIFKRLMAQSGVLKGSGRTCSAFETGKSKIRTALHCIAGLDENAIKKLRFLTSTGKSLLVSRVVLRASSHDSVELETIDTDEQFQSLQGTPVTDLDLNLVSWDARSDLVSISPPCRLLALDVMSGALTHDCESFNGSSGGTLIQDGLVVGLHLGSLGNQKLGVVVKTDSKRPISSDLWDKFQPEYNCASDCRAAAYTAVPYLCPNLRNPRKVCHEQVFDATLFSACQAARTGDCSIQSLSHVFSTARSNVNSEINNLSGSVAETQRRLSSVVTEVGSIEVQLDQVRSSIRGVVAESDRIGRDIVNRSNAIGQSRSEIQSFTAKLKEVRTASGQVLERQRSLTASISTVAKKVTDTTAMIHAKKNLLEIAQQEASKQLPKLQLAEERRQIVRQSLALQEAVSALSRKSVELTLKAGDELKDKAAIEMRKGADAVLALSSGGNGMMHPLRLADFAAKMGKFIGDGFKKIHSAADQWLNPQQNVDKDARVLNRRLTCVKRTNDRLDEYTKALKTLGIAEWPANPLNITLAMMANAEQLVAYHQRSFATLRVEIAANNCEAIGLHQVIEESLTDAVEWLSWIEDSRLALSLTLN